MSRDALDILNDLDPEEVKNILWRIKLQSESAQAAPLSETVSELPEAFPPVDGEYVPIDGHDPYKILITDENGIVTTDESLEYRNVAGSLVPGTPLASGSIPVTDGAGIVITGLVIGQWYSLECTGG